MPTIGDVVRRLLPDDDLWRRRWPDVPIWPPDLFAIAGTLVRSSGCYSHRRYTGHWERQCLFDERYVKEVVRLGSSWRSGDPGFFGPVVALWDELKAARDEEVGYNPRRLRPPGWCTAAIKLLGIADEAAAGLGFKATGEARPFADFLIGEYRKWERGRKPTLRFLPDSLCLDVPPEEVCVQPKLLTAQAGCSIRSLSHHLALLPGTGVIRTAWLMGNLVDVPHSDRFRLLLVPFPYSMGDDCFRTVPQRSDEVAGPRFFSVRQRWLGGNRRPKPRRAVSAKDVVSFLAGLVQAALEHGDRVDGIVLPETSLSARLAQGVAKGIEKKVKGLELFVAGTLGESANRLPVNAAYVVPFVRGRWVGELTQAKHHRWGLEKSQIERYRLAGVLDPRRLWWEQTDISERGLAMHVFRKGAGLTALVCEDLARMDPAHEVVRAIGPNLVIVLLMDGAQRRWRWSGRYAQILADDPGCSVLTLTSQCLIRRSTARWEREPVALWAEPNRPPQELRLRKGAHALLLTLQAGGREQRTLDRRTAGEPRPILSLLGRPRSVTLKEAPGWL